MLGLERIRSLQTDPTSSLQVGQLGFRRPQNRHRVHLPGKDYWQVRFFHRPVWVRTNAESELQEWPAETLILQSPDCYLEFRSVAFTGEHSWIVLEGKGWTKLFGEFSVPISDPIHFPRPDLTDGLFRDLHQDAYNGVRQDVALIGALFRPFLLRVQRSLEERNTPSLPAEFMACRRYIEANFAKPLTLRELAEMAHLSPSHFCTMFRRHFYVAPIDYLLQTRLRHAQLLLSDSRLRIGEIAAECGYNDVFVFSKLFKRHFGVSPSHYRG